MRDIVIEKPKNPTLWLSLFMLFFVVVSILSFVQASRESKLYKSQVKGNYVEEEATIVRYEANFVEEEIYNNYSVFYEYVDDEGHVYSGIWNGSVRREQDAKDMIGQKVTIYVDHETKTHVKSLSADVGAWAYGIVGGFCALGFILVFLREMLYVERWRSYKSELKRVNEVSKIGN